VQSPWTAGWLSQGKNDFVVWVAVKVVDNDAQKSVEIVEWKVNGVVEKRYCESSL